MEAAGAAEEQPEPGTAVKAKVLRGLNTALLAVPQGFTINPKLAKQLDRRLTAFDDPQGSANFDRLSPRFDRLYSDMGRPSIAPEKLLRALLLQVLYTVRSERQLMEQLNYNMLFRWFVGLGMDDAVWAPTTFTKNRDRLLAAASQLFHENGVQATGVDLIVGEAGVAKATFYRHFPSKDDLIIAWLRDPRTRWLDRIRAEVDTSDADAAERIPMFFEVVADWLETDSYRGSPYLNTLVEIRDPMHPARRIIREYFQEVEDYLDGLISAAGYRDSRMLAAEIETLISGATTLAVVHASRTPVLAARDAAVRLLAGAARR